MSPQMTCRSFFVPAAIVFSSFRLLFDQAHNSGLKTRPSFEEGCLNSAPNYRFDKFHKGAPGHRGSVVITPPYRFPYIAGLPSSLRESVSKFHYPPYRHRGLVYQSQLADSVDRSEADPSSSRRFLLRSSMDFVPVSRLFSFQ